MMEDRKQLEFILNVLNEIPHSKSTDWFWDKISSKIKNRTVEVDYNSSKQKQLETSSDVSYIKDLKKDTSKILNYLAISPECSIDYSFIKHTLLKTRLELDNLRMENIRYNMNEKDENRRLYDYILNAFYQVENLINFYYHEKFKSIETIIIHLESIEHSKFKRNNEKNLGDINIATKIFAFNMTFYKEKNGDFTGYNIDSLRLIRNEGSHRITRIKSIENENKRLFDFMQHTTFDSIHSLVNNLALKVKDNL